MLSPAEDHCVKKVTTSTEGQQIQEHVTTCLTDEESGVKGG